MVFYTNRSVSGSGLYSRQNCCNKLPQNKLPEYGDVNESHLQHLSTWKAKVVASVHPVSFLSTLKVTTTESCKTFFISYDTTWKRINTHSVCFHCYYPPRRSCSLLDDQLVELWTDTEQVHEKGQHCVAVNSGSRKKVNSEHDAEVICWIQLMLLHSHLQTAVSL